MNPKPHDREIRPNHERCRAIAIRQADLRDAEFIAERETVLALHRQLEYFRRRLCTHAATRAEFALSHRRRTMKPRRE